MHHSVRLCLAGLVTLVSAGPTWALTYQMPAVCKDVLSASYEVGGGKDISNHVKLTCRKSDGKVSTFITWTTNGWGLIGLNRLTQGDGRVDFEPGTGDKMTCK